MAISAAIAAFRYPDGIPGMPVLAERQSYFNLLHSYYSNETFTSLSAWSQYREGFQLYRNIRSIYNPTKRLVNFYVAHVYPGVLSEDASKLPDGIQLAIPFSDDTDDKLKEAIAQFWQWSNWQSNNKLMVRFGGITGSCLVEIFDNVERGKVSANVVWPGLMATQSWDTTTTGLVLDDVGNVKFYALEHQAMDSSGQPYIYRKEVTPESFKYYRDGAPFVPDGVEAEEVPNPYGFVPAVWCKHIDEGDDYGAPAISGSLGKIDELNGLVSHVHDQVDRIIESPGIIAATGRVGALGTDAANIKNAAADEFSAVAAVKEKPTKLLVLKGPPDTKWIPMVGNLDPSQVIPNVDRLLTEIEHDFPELGMYQELRKMSQVTGPGAARMMGDVGARVMEVAGNYDTQSIKLFQMALAIGGFRYREGKEGWRTRSAQQAKFAPFDLTSYAKDQLAIAILPRPLIPLTEDDTITLNGKRLDNAKKAQGIFDDRRVLETAGITDEDEQQEILDQRATESQGAPLAVKTASGLPEGVQSLLGAVSVPPRQIGNGKLR